MARRSNLIVILGLAVFLVGAGATYLVVRGDGDGTPPAPAGPQVAVLYAAAPIPTGTTGTDAVSRGLVRSRGIAESAKPVNALTDTSQLAGQVAILGVAQGSVLTSDQFRNAQTRIGSLEIPDGKTALALQVSNVAGVAGFAGAGDRINIYGLIRPGAEQESGAARLIMEGIEVLNVNGTTLPTAQGQPGGTGLVFLLAVDPLEAEQLVYLTSFQSLYFALATQDSPPFGATPGILSPIDGLKQL